MQVLSKLLEPNDKSQKVVSPFPLDNRSQARLQSIIRILKKAIKSVGLKNPFGNTQPTRPYQKKV
jgi:hypothetical protein